MRVDDWEMSELIIMANLIKRNFWKCQRSVKGAVYTTLVRTMREVWLSGLESPLQKGHFLS